MKVFKLVSNDGYANSFVVTDGGSEGILIDCATSRVIDECKKLDVKIKAVLLTHGHFDHVSGCSLFSAIGADICCGEREKDLVFSPEYLGIFGGVTVPSFDINRVFKDGEEIEICGLKIKVISTPGHTAGSVCYIIGDCLFTGDMLFKDSIGRCDLPTGNCEDMAKSLIKLRFLNGDYKIYSGHSEETTLSREKKYNPYLRIR